jgi:hypothetical protein
MLLDPRQLDIASKRTDPIDDERGQVEALFRRRRSRLWASVL